MMSEPYMGNILGNFRETVPPRLQAYYNGRLYTFELDYHNFRVSPLIPVQVWKYKYTNPDNRILTKVKEWFINVKITVIYNDKTVWAKFLDFLNLISNVLPSTRQFNDSGIYEPYEISYWSPGYIKIPVDIEDINPSRIDYFKGKLKGYEGLEIMLRSKKTYPRPMISIDYFFDFDITGDLQAFAVKDILPILPNM